MLFVLSILHGIRSTPHTRVARLACTIVVCIGIGAGCAGVDIDPGSAAAPSLIGPGGTSGYPFGGHLYPRSGPVQYPGRWGTAGVFELDAPLRTVVRSDTSLVFGPAYYAFTVNVRVEGLRTLLLQWGADNNTQNMERVDGPCDPQTGAAARAFMHATSTRETGTVNVAAYDMLINDKLVNEEALWWVTCDPDAPGEIISTSPARVDYNIAVLVPSSRLGRSGSGRLLIASKPLGNGPISDTLRISLQETPRIFAVAGDSMAWGQGLNYQEKWWWRVYEKARSNSEEDRFDRLYVRAHSASHLNGGQDSIAAVANRGCTPSSTHQELPLGADSVQCQLVQIAHPDCTIDTAMLDQPGVVPNVSCEQTAEVSEEALTAPLPGSMQSPDAVEIHHGPRVDFLFLDGCINDVGAVDIHTNLEGSLNDLINSIDVECDVNNSLPDLREQFPNANIVWLGYHHTWSDKSAVLNPLRCPAALTINVIASPLGWPFSNIVVASTQEAVNDIGERATLFRERSDQVLEQSIATLAGDQPGRGEIRFLPLEFFGAEQAAYGPESLNWELNCIDPALQTQDSVLNQRYPNCEAAIDVLTIEELIAGIDWFATDWNDEAMRHAALMFCQRAPFLHPNDVANIKMGDEVIDLLGNAL